MTLNNHDEMNISTRYQIMFGYIGSILRLVSLIFFVPLIMAAIYPDETQYLKGFLVAGTLLSIISWGLFLHYKSEESPSVSVQESMLMTVIIWVVAIGFGSIPFHLHADLTISQSIFEATSGLTTCGLTLLDVDSLPKTILFYRSLLQFIGGLGFIVVGLSAISAVAPADENLSSVAASYAVYISSDIRRASTIILGLYGAYVLIGTIAFYVAGMNAFDAINHTLTGVATGGFSTRAESFGYWSDPIIEIIAIVLMLLGAINFSTMYLLVRSQFRNFVRQSEVRVTALLLPPVIVLLALSTTLAIYPTETQAIRVAIFEATSALTGTGFTTTSYVNWIGSGWLILIGLMIIGGGRGSTTGGIKQNRFEALVIAISWRIRQLLASIPEDYKPEVWRGEEPESLNEKRVHQISIFVLIYLTTLFIGTLWLSLYGYGLKESFFEFASTLGTVGLSSGITSTDSPTSMIWMQSVAMLLGRLEFYAVIVGLMKLRIDFQGSESTPVDEEEDDS